MKKLLACSALISAGVLTATAFAQPARPPAAAPAAASSEVCLQFNRLNRWSVVNSRTLEITDDLSKKYRVEMNHPCSHSSFVDKVVIRRLGKSGLSCVEPGDQIILSQKNVPEERCLVSSVSLYTDAQRELDKKVEPAKP